MTYDSASRIISINDANYSYDSTDQLIGAEYDNQADETYEYDETGNRTNYEIGANNQILSDGVYNYTYDAEGNRISKTNIDPNITDTTIYEWDHRNRLITVTIITDTNATVVNYRYDYLNRLISRTVEQTDNKTNATQTTTQHFIHDGNQIILEFLDNELSQRNFWGTETDELLAVDNLIDDETL
jgi:YD repeat-containing protein